MVLNEQESLRKAVVKICQVVCAATGSLFKACCTAA